MWNSLSETLAKRYYWELKDKPGYFWNGRQKKPVADPKRRSEYRSMESAKKYAPPNLKEWELKQYLLWRETVEYTSQKTLL